MKNIDKYRYKCKMCGDILIPDGKGNLTYCSCHKLGIDSKYDTSGEGYCRVLGNPDDYEEMIK